MLHVPCAGNKKFIGSQAKRTAPCRPASINRRTAVVAEANAKLGKIKKCVLAYSGGLDTSIILKWLQDEYGCEVITFTADLGQVRTCQWRAGLKSAPYRLLTSPLSLTG